MMRLPVIAVFVALAFVPARAEELRCPARANAAVVKVLYLFSVKDPKTFATCVYSDGTDHAIDLRKGCSVDPVDAFHDGRDGGMHECRQTGSEPTRCRIICPTT